MCLTKRRMWMKPIKADKDIYVVKFGMIYNNIFISDVMDFVYKQDSTYQKHWWNLIRAFFPKYLSKTVFHTFSVDESKFRIKYWLEGSILNNRIGVFKILKDSYYYIGSGGMHIGCFKMEYLGKISEKTRHLVLNQ